MKNALTDTKVNLKELPSEGRVYTYTRESGELNAALKDLIGNNEFRVSLSILPQSDCFLLQGEVEASYDLVCPRCAIDFIKPHPVKINELLMVDSTEDYRNGSQSRHNIITDNSDEIYCHMIDNHEFNIADFIHEIIGINEPHDALAKPDCDKNCENLKMAIEKGWIEISVEEDGSFKESYSPFDSLKEIKLNS